MVCSGLELPCSTTDATGSTSYYCSYGGACIGLSPPSSPTTTSPNGNVIIILPSLTLNGPATVYIRLNSSYSACVGSSTLNCDLGATATQTINGDLNGAVRACKEKATLANPSPYAIVGLLYCGINVMVPGSYFITYSVSGLNGTSASVQRLVVVLSTCAEGLQQCLDGSCAAECFRVSFLSSTSTNDPQPAIPWISSSTNTIASPTSISPQQATISLAPRTRPSPSLTLAPGLPSPVLIPKGWPYVRCSSDQVPTVSQPCETGAIASDAVDGPAIQGWILMCPSPACSGSNGGCSGDRVIDKQPSACGIDSINHDIGTTLSLSFAVYNSAGLGSSIQRVLQIVSPCNSTQFYCMGVCSNIDCDLLVAIVNASPTIPSSASSSLTAGSPTLVLLPYGNLDSSTQWGLSGKNQSVFLEWGVAAPFSLAPCSSWSVANLTSTPSCAAAAYDVEAGDISSFIEVDDVWTDQSLTCTVASITLGSCLPGQHVMQYQVSGPQSIGGLLTQAYLNVFIEERASVNFSFTFMPDDDSFNEASASSLSSQLVINASVSWTIAYK